MEAVGSMGDVLEPLRRDSTPERIAAQLRSGIVSGRLAGGQALREVEIARQLGVSRGPVREAFQRLIQEGLLEAHPARGVFVPQLLAEDIADLYLARGAVETAAARLLASSGSDLKDLEAALAELEAAPADDWNVLVSLDLNLHEVLVRSTGSKRLARMFGTLAAETRLCMVAQGGELKLLRLTQKVTDILQITKLYTVFHVLDDENAALTAFAS